MIAVMCAFFINLTEPEPKREFRISTYSEGLVMNQLDADFSGAIKRAIADAQSYPEDLRKVILFGPGVYRVGCNDSAGEMSHINISGLAAKKITLLGMSTSNGLTRTKLLFKNHRCYGIFVGNDALDTTIENIDIAFERSSIAFGKVTKVDFESQTGRPYVEVDQSLTSPMSFLENGVFSGVSTAATVWGFMAEKNLDYPFSVITPKIVKLSENQFRIYEDSASFTGVYSSDFLRWKTLTKAAVGRTYSQMARFSVAALYFNRAKGVLVRDIAILNSPNLASLLINNFSGSVYPSITFDTYVIRFDPALSETPVTTNADGIHSIGNRTPVVVKNSSFEGMADDAIALHLRASEISSINNREIVLVKIYDPGGGGDVVDFLSDDIITVFDTFNGESVCSNFLGSVIHPLVPVRTGYWKLQLNSPVAENTCSDSVLASISSELSANPHRYRVYNQSMASQENLIENNTFKKFRGGIRMLVKGEIRNNNFYQNGPYKILTGIDLTNPGYSSTLSPQDIRITQNRFYSPSLEESIAQAGGSEIKMFVSGTQTQSLNAVKNVAIVSNYFEDSQREVMMISNCSDCNVYGNMIFARKNYMLPIKSLISVTNSQRVNIGHPMRSLVLDVVAGSNNANTLESGILFKNCSSCSVNVEVKNLILNGITLPLLLSK